MICNRRLVYLVLRRKGLIIDLQRVLTSAEVLFFCPENSTIASGEVNTILFITVRVFQETRSYYHLQRIPWLTPDIIPCLAHWIFPSDYKIASCFAQTREYCLAQDNFSLSSLKLVPSKILYPCKCPEVYVRGILSQFWSNKRFSQTAMFCPNI